MLGSDLTAGLLLKKSVGAYLRRVTLAPVELGDLGVAGGVGRPPKVLIGRVVERGRG